MAKKQYFTLVGKSAEYPQWEAIFGSYDKAELIEEKEIQIENGEYNKFKILVTAPDQNSIVAAINALN